MKGVSYTLDLMLATAILISITSIYFSLVLDELEYPSQTRSAYMLDNYMFGLITSAEKTGILDASILDTTNLRKVLNESSISEFGSNICIYVEIYPSSTFYSGGAAPLSLYLPGCSSIDENARIYYRHIYREDTPASGYYVYKFYAWYK